MFIQHIQASMGKAPEKEKTCYEDKRDQETLKYKFFLFTFGLKIVYHFNIVFVNTILSGFTTLPKKNSFLTTKQAEKAQSTHPLPLRGCPPKGGLIRLP